MDEQEILAHTAHRPWPLPSEPWAGRMTWHDLLFAHWPVDPDYLRRVLPEPLELDTHEGAAYVGVIPFWMSNVRPRALPGVPTATNFPELNVRTYVKGAKRETGPAKPGVYFFSLDVTSVLAMLGARFAYGLRYYWAHMNVVLGANDRVAYQSARRIRPRPAELVCDYMPSGPVREKTAVEHFVTERYCLYAVWQRGQVYRADIHHIPWQLQSAEATFRVNSMAAACGIELSDPLRPPMLNFAKRMDVVTWLPERVA